MQKSAKNYLNFPYALHPVWSPFLTFPDNKTKILVEMGIPNYLTSLLKTLYAGQEATVRTEHRTTDWFQIRKGVRQGCVLSLCLFNLYAECSMRNAGLNESQAGSATSDVQMIPP